MNILKILILIKQFIVEYGHCLKEKSLQYHIRTINYKL
jgi:hypothetical protein